MWGEAFSSSPGGAYTVRGRQRRSAKFRSNMFLAWPLIHHSNTQARMGLHCGPVIGGIVGVNLPRCGRSRRVIPLSPPPLRSFPVSHKFFFKQIFFFYLG